MGPARDAGKGHYERGVMSRHPVISWNLGGTYPCIRGRKRRKILKKERISIKERMGGAFPVSRLKGEE